MEKGISPLLLKSFTQWLFDNGVKMKAFRKDYANIKDGDVMSSELTKENVFNMISLYVTTPEFQLLSMLKRLPQTKKDCMICGERHGTGLIDVKKIGVVHKTCLERAKQIAPEHAITKLILENI